MNELINYVCLAQMYMQCLQRLEEGTRDLGTRVMEGCKLLYMCWELNPGPLQE